MTDATRSGIGPLLNVPAEAHAAWTALHRNLLQLRYQVPCTDEPELFTSNNPADRQVATAICSSCPIQQSCRTYARAAREPLGVWGGEDRSARQIARTPMPDDLTRAEAAKLTGISLSALDAAVTRGRIRRGTNGMYNRAELLAWRSEVPTREALPRSDKPGDLTTAEAAELCDVKPTAVLSWISRGRIERCQNGLINRAELLAWRSGRTTSEQK